MMSDTTSKTTAEDLHYECPMCPSSGSSSKTETEQEQLIPTAHYVEMTQGQVNLIRRGQLHIEVHHEGERKALAIEGDESLQYCVCACADCIRVGNLLPHTCRYKHLRALRSHSQ